VSEPDAHLGSITRFKEGIAYATGCQPVQSTSATFPQDGVRLPVKKHLAERSAKGFTCRTQFVAMTFCQLAHADSLREIYYNNASGPVREAIQKRRTKRSNRLLRRLQTVMQVKSIP
jgi:hypothetical protein